jgi:hypothetical protein
VMREGEIFEGKEVREGKGKGDFGGGRVREMNGNGCGVLREAFKLSGYGMVENV